MREASGGFLLPHPWSWKLFNATSEQQLFAANEREQQRQGERQKQRVLIGTRPHLPSKIQIRLQNQLQSVKTRNPCERVHMNAEHRQETSTVTNDTKTLHSVLESHSAPTVQGGGL